VNGQDGLFSGGGAGLLVDRFIGAVAVLLVSGIVTDLIAVGIDRTIGTRVSPDDELTGLDQTQYAETAYQA
jgi:Amt family ammonium transporter